MFAFRGVMNAKALAEYNKKNGTTVQTNVTVKSPKPNHAPAGGTKERPQEVSLDKLRSLDPTLIEYERG